MRQMGVDHVSVLAIVVGAAIGFGTTGVLLDGPEHKRAPVTERVAKDVGGEAARARVEAHPGTQAVIPLRTAEPAYPDPTQPVVFIDGVRVSGIDAVQELDPDRVDRIEVIKGGVVFEELGETEATRGVIQVFLKPEATEQGGR